MTGKSFRTFWFVSCFVVAACPGVLGQLTTTADVSQGSLSTAATTGDMTGEDLPKPVEDETGSSITKGSVVLGLSGINEQINAGSDQVVDSGGRSSASSVAGMSSFGTSATAPTVRWSPAGSDALWGAPATARTGSGASRGDSASAARAPGGLAKASLSRSSVSPPGAAFGTGSGHSASGMGAGAAEMSGASLPSRSNSASASEGGENALPQAFSAASNANYSTAFPDSTRGTALLSPPDSEESPFGTPGGELASGFPDLNQTEFLSLSLRASTSGRSSSEQRASLYERFLNRLKAERSGSSMPSTGLTQDKLGTSTLKTHLESETGLMPSSGMDQGGLSSHPY